LDRKNVIYYGSPSFYKALFCLDDKNMTTFAFFNPIRREWVYAHNDGAVSYALESIENDIINHCLEHDYKYDLLDAQLHNQSRVTFQEEMEEIVKNGTTNKGEKSQAQKESESASNQTQAQSSAS
jgi:hypothetical protein